MLEGPAAERVAASDLDELVVTNTVPLPGAIGGLFALTVCLACVVCVCVLRVLFVCHLHVVRVAYVYCLCVSLTCCACCLRVSIACVAYMWHLHRANEEAAQRDATIIGTSASRSNESRVRQ